MATTLDELHAWMQAQENERLEFKAATRNFDSRELAKYCAAIANEGGGKFILGVSNAIPRKVVGSQAFPNIERTKAGLANDLHLRIDLEELQHQDHRVIICHVPPHPLGMPVPYKGAYWMRAGESLMEMTPDMLKRIFDESGPDFSSEVCPKARPADLDPSAIQRFRTMWQRKSGNESLGRLSEEHLLADAELLVHGGITYAALILLGTPEALARLFAQAEVILEYRSNEASIPYSQRREYRQGFFLYDDDLWSAINTRNDVQHYQDGLFIWDIPTFSERVVREAILNAVSHRDYRLAGSVFVRQFPRKLEIVSPGGFPPGITPQNVLRRQLPRNRRIAETFAKCGLVERSGQGFDRMFEESIRQGKRLPDFAGTDEYQVSITLHGEIQDARFLQFLEKVGSETSASFSTEDLMVLDLVHREQAIPDDLKAQVRNLAEQAVIEPVGSRKGARYILSRKFYAFLGKKGVYTRKRGLDREQNKELLVKHLQQNAAAGSQLQELMQVLSLLTREQVKSLLQELKAEDRVHVVGRTRAARWYPGPSPECDLHGSP